MSTITEILGTDLIKDSREDINNNFEALNDEKIETSVIDTDTTLAANSDAKIPSQKAVKAYVDSGGNVNASETQKGIVEEATDAEVTAGTATGATGAKLFITPAKLATRLSSTSLNPVVRTYLNAASPATWTKPAGLKYVIVEVQAAGGNGGAVTGTDASAGGGGAGGYSKKLIATASLGATETVTIGAVGASSSFGSHCSATNGTSATTDSTAGAAGGSSTGGDINITGGNGDTVIGGAGHILGGRGGASILGNCGSATSNGAGANATGYGAGGGGASVNGSTDYSGGTGGPAIVIVTEYYV